MYKPLILMTGASGFIGKQLTSYLLAKDYRIVALTRQHARHASHPDLNWVTHFSQIKNNDIDYVINLAGENIGQGRWTDSRKNILLESRLQTTRQLFDFLVQRDIQPKVIISASAVGFYGIDPTERWSDVCTEQDSEQDIFMSQLCAEWEKLACSYTGLNTKIMRLGVVLGQGGALPQMLLPIKLNLFGKIGSGRQPFAWVHQQDVLSAIYFMMHDQSASKVFNVVAPEQTSQYRFAQTAAQLLKRRPFFSLPAGVLELMLQEQSMLILNGQYVQPKALVEAGFHFKYPTLKAALQDVLHLN